MSSAFIKAASLLGGLLTIIALVIAFLRQLIDLVGFLMMAIKLVLLFGFIGLLLFVGLLVYRTMRERRREREDS